MTVKKAENHYTPAKSTNDTSEPTIQSIDRRLVIFLKKDNLVNMGAVRRHLFY